MRKRFALISIALVVLGGAGALLFDRISASRLGLLDTHVSSNRDSEFADEETSIVLASIDPSHPIRLAIGGLGFADDGMDGQLGDLILVELSSAQEFELIDRRSLGAVLREAELNLSGFVRAPDAIRVGRLIRSDWFLLGGLTTVNGTNAMIARVVDARSGVIREAAIFQGWNSLRSLAVEVAEFVRAVHAAGLQSRRQAYLAIGGFENLSLNNRYPDLPDHLRTYLVGSYQNSHVQMLEREAMDALLHEVQLDLAGFTDKAAAAAIARAQCAFWLVDGLYQSYEESGLEVDIVLRIHRLRGYRTTTSLRGEPGEALFRQVREAIEVAVAKSDALMQPAARGREIAAQMRIGVERSHLSPNDLAGDAEFWFSWRRYIPIEAHFPDHRSEQVASFGGTDPIKRRQNLEAGIEAFQTVLLLDPDDREAKMYLAACFRSPAIDRVGEARDLYREIIGSGIEDHWTQMARKALAFSHVNEDDLRLAELFDEVASHSKYPKEAAAYTEAAQWARASHRRLHRDADANLSAAEGVLMDSLGQVLTAARSNGAVPKLNLGVIGNLRAYHPEEARRVRELVPKLTEAFPELAPYIVMGALTHDPNPNSPVWTEFRQNLDRYGEHPEELLDAESWYAQIAGSPYREASDHGAHDVVVRIAEIYGRAVESGYVSNRLDVGWRARLLYGYLGVHRYADALPIAEAFGENPIQMSTGGPWGEHHAPFLPGKVAAALRKRLELTAATDSKLFDLGAPFFEAGGQFAFSAGTDGLWVCDFHNLRRLSPSGQEMGKWSLPTRHDARPTAIIAVGDHVWIGTKGAGLLEFDRISGAFRQYTMEDGLLLDDIGCLTRDGGTLWIGFYHDQTGFKRGGVGRFDIQAREFTAFVSPLSTNTLAQARPWKEIWGSRFAMRNQPPRHPVAGVALDPKGNLWAGVFETGIQRYDPSGKTWETFRASDYHNEVSCLAIDSERLFAGCFGGYSYTHSAGVRKMSGGLTIHPLGTTNWIHLDVFSGLPANSITALAPHRGDLWMGGFGFVGMMDLDSQKMRKVCYVEAPQVERLQVTDEHLWVQLGSRLHRVPLASTQ